MLLFHKTSFWVDTYTSIISTVKLKNNNMNLMGFEK